MRRILTLVAGLLLLFAAKAALASPVLVVSGEILGQGWMFKRNDVCLIASAKHVLKNGSALVVSEVGDVGQIVDVRFHPELDIAVGRIEGEKIKAACVSDTLGYADSRPALRQLGISGAPLVQVKIPYCLNTDLAKTQCGSLIRVPVTLDSYGGNDVTLSFFSTGPIQQSGGDSGSVILQHTTDGVMTGQPLGLVTNASEDPDVPSIAVIFSEVRKFVESLDAKSTRAVSAASLGQRARASLVEYRGVIANTECGPLNIFQQNSCVFSAAPLGGGKARVELVLQLQPGFAPSALVFTFGTTALPKGVEILVSDDDYGDLETMLWNSLRYCRVADVRYLRCQINSASHKFILLRFSGAVSLASLTFEGE